MDTGSPPMSPTFYHIVDTPFGYAALGFRVRPFRLIEVKLPRPDLNALCRPLDERGWQIDNRHPEASAIAALLADYFAGRRVATPWPVMDLSRFTPSQQAVYRTVADIPYGHTASYGQVARLANLPRAARFVGNTMARNAYPVFIPCHRVIKSDGTVGGFGGGRYDTELKRRMLALEAAGS